MTFKIDKEAPKQDKFAFGYTDPRAMYGDPSVEWEPIIHSRKHDWSEAIAAVGFGLGVSMAVAPMAWVEMIKWIFTSTST
jgi:hypothetical protein